MCAADKKIFNPSINASNNNRIDTTNGFAFDNAGNTTRDAQNRKFTYDGENKQIKVETVDANGTVTGTLGEYFYDGDGKRVKKYSFENNQWLTTLFVYDASGKLVEEYSTVLATTPQVSYLINDHLGSPRINTNQNGFVTARHDYQPFGEDVARISYGEDEIRKKFTSYERDKETGLDFAQARYYAKNYGRFISADPIFIKDDRLLDPQKLNLYIYVRNNPFKYVDVSGEDITIANAVAQQQVRAYIDQNLTSAAERNNIQIQGNKVVIVNPTAINPANASEGYRLLYEFIGPNAKLNATYYGIKPGQTITTSATQQTLTYQTVANSGDITFHISNTDIEVVVAVGANVQAADSQTPPAPTAFPEHLIFAHGLAHGSCGNDGMCATKRENLLRQEQGSPQRSTTIGHRNYDANGNDITVPFNNDSVTIQGNSPQPVVTTQGTPSSNIVDMPLIPLPTPKP